MYTYKQTTFFLKCNATVISALPSKAQLRGVPVDFLARPLIAGTLEYSLGNQAMKHDVEHYVTATGSGVTGSVSRIVS